MYFLGLYIHIYMCMSMYTCTDKNSIAVSYKCLCAFGEIYEFLRENWKIVSEDVGEGKTFRVLFLKVIFALFVHNLCIKTKKVFRTRIDLALIRSNRIFIIFNGVMYANICMPSYMFKFSDF